MQLDLIHLDSFKSFENLPTQNFEIAEHQDFEIADHYCSQQSRRPCLHSNNILAVTESEQSQETWPK